MTVYPFGTAQGGDAVQRVSLASGDLSVALLTRGAILQDVRLAGVPHSLTVGSPDLAAYEGVLSSCGAIVGPVANRINGGRAVIDGKVHEFTGKSDAGVLLHGGNGAVHKRNWTLAGHDDGSATLQLNLPDGVGGFPGNRTIRARFEIFAPATLRLTLTATTDAPTLMNLANHSYWRLDDAPTFRGHTLRVAAEHYLPTNSDNVPTGEIAPVAGTPMDFRTARPLAADGVDRLDKNHCLSESRQPLRPVAWLTAPSGLAMEMATTEPGLQVFDAFQMDLPQFTGNDGQPFRAFAGLALEAQFWPDAPNHPAFPQIVMRPGDDWEQVTEWRFSRG